MTSRRCDARWSLSSCCAVLLSRLITLLQLAQTFARKHSLDDGALAKLEMLLKRKVADNALE